MVDVLLSINLLINFCTAYQNQKSSWVSDRSKVARHNLAHGFLADLSAILPIDWLLLRLGNPAYARYLRLLKLACLLSAYWRKDRRGLLQLSRTQKMPRLALSLLCCTHWASCAWFVVGGGASRLREMLLDPDKPMPQRWYSALVEEDAHHFAAIAHNRDEFSWPMYLVSSLWITTTISSQGVVDGLLPQTYHEMVFAIGMVLSFRLRSAPIRLFLPLLCR